MEDWDVDRLFLFLTNSFVSSDSFASLAATAMLPQSTVLGGLEDGDMANLRSLLSLLCFLRSLRTFLLNSYRSVFASQSLSLSGVVVPSSPFLVHTWVRVVSRVFGCSLSSCINFILKNMNKTDKILDESDASQVSDVLNTYLLELCGFTYMNSQNTRKVRYD